MHAANFLFALLSLALLAGCGNPTNDSNPDTGVEADADADADADGDTDSDTDADFKAVVNGETDLKGSTLNIPGATCTGTSCEVDKPGSYEGCLDAPGYLTICQATEIDAPGEYTLLFDGEGQYAAEIRDGIYEGEFGEYEVSMDIYDGFIQIDLGSGIWSTVTGDYFFGELDNGSYEEGLIISDVEIYFFNWSSFYPDDPIEDTITFVRPS
ncbi:MAG: hypothetical protein V1716_05310 [Candidatus Uhrbacteria bacterium]